MKEHFYFFIASMLLTCSMVHANPFSQKNDNLNVPDNLKITDQSFNTDNQISEHKFFTTKTMISIGGLVVITMGLICWFIRKMHNNESRHNYEGDPNDFNDDAILLNDTSD